MSCKRWEQAIALEEIERPGLAEHLAVCESCRRLADEIAETRRILGALAEPVIEPVSPLVLDRLAASGVTRMPRWAWLAAAAAAIVLVLWVWPTQRPTPAVPRQRIITAVHPTGAKEERRPSTPKHQVVARAHARRHSATSGEVKQVTIQTSDPNVVLIWILD